MAAKRATLARSEDYFDWSSAQVQTRACVPPHTHTLFGRRCCSAVDFLYEANVDIKFDSQIVNLSHRVLCFFNCLSIHFVPFFFLVFSCFYCDLYFIAKDLNFTYRHTYIRAFTARCAAPPPYTWSMSIVATTCWCVSPEFVFPTKVPIW